MTLERRQFLKQSIGVGIGAGIALSADPVTVTDAASLERAIEMSARSVSETSTRGPGIHTYMWAEYFDRSSHAQESEQILCQKAWGHIRNLVANRDVIWRIRPRFQVIDDLVSVTYIVHRVRFQMGLRGDSRHPMTIWESLGKVSGGAEGTRWRW